MFRFRLGSIPVEVHFSHLLVSGGARLAVFLPTPRPPGLAGRAPGDPSSPAMPGGGAAVLAWMSSSSSRCSSTSWAMRWPQLAFGYQPSIALVSWLGGDTRPNAAGPLSLAARTWCSRLAGPLFGLALGVAVPGGLLRLPAGSVGARSRSSSIGSARPTSSGRCSTCCPVAAAGWGRHHAARLLTRFFGRWGFIVAHGLGAAGLSGWRRRGLELDRAAI